MFPYYFYLASVNSSIGMGGTAQNKIYLGFTSTTNFWIGVFFLFLMVVPFALIAPLTINLPIKDTYIKAAWRTQGCVLLTTPIVCVMYYFQVSGLNFKSDFSLPVIVKTFLSDILVFGWLIFYIQGCTYSLTSHADIMSCSSGTVIFIITVVTCGVVHKYEVFAYILYFVGIFFLLTDPYALKEGKTEISYLGVILAINGAICLAIFSYTIKYIKSQLHPIVQTEILFLTMLVCVFTLFPFLSKSEKFFSFDPEFGVFGWLTNWTYFFEVVCITAFVSGLLGNIGYFFSFKYFPIEIVNGALLFEPLIAQIAGSLLGQDQMPGIKTLIGCLLITVCYFLASIGSKIKEQAQLTIKEKVLEDISKEIELSVSE